jgi:hypothetical protein
MISQYLIGGTMPESANPIQPCEKIIEIRPSRGGWDTNGVSTFDPRYCYEAVIGDIHMSLFVLAVFYAGMFSLMGGNPPLRELFPRGSGLSPNSRLTGLFSSRTTLTMSCTGAALVSWGNGSPCLPVTGRSIARRSLGAYSAAN